MKGHCKSLERSNYLNVSAYKSEIGEACLGYFGIRDIHPIFILGYGILTRFILGYGIFRNFGIWDIEINFGIRVQLILGYGIFWTVYFGIWDIAYPPKQAS